MHMHNTYTCTVIAHTKHTIVNVPTCAPSRRLYMYCTYVHMHTIMHSYPHMYKCIHTSTYTQMHTMHKHIPFLKESSFASVSLSSGNGCWMREAGTRGSINDAQEVSVKHTRE